MYHYLFTNDLRISVLDESLKKAGHCFATNTVPSSTVDKSANNNMMTLGFYFTLNEESNCAKVAAGGNTRAVVLNFIKKFQFPNLRTTAAFNDSVNDGIKLAPMRIIVKLLYVMNLLHGDLVAYLTKEEIRDFIFYNENVAKKKKPDIAQLISDILEYRKTGVYPTSVSTNEAEHEWKHEDRQIREMLKVLQWSGCITEKDGKFVIDNDELSDRNKADVFDIITCDTFWEGSTIESYRAYMDMEDIHVDIEINEEDPEERNKRLFRYWLSMQVKPEDDSDAGNPYAEDSINRYVRENSRTYLTSVPDKSVFYTTDIGEVQLTCDAITDDPTRKSAVLKYNEYLGTVVSEEDCEGVFNHRLFGMHIKQQNTALSIENPHICIGWSAMGDLSDVSSKEQLAHLYDEHFDKNPRGKGQDVGQVWRFLNDMQIGDYVIFAEHSVFHIGRVESDYYYDEKEYTEQSADYKNNRKVRWLKKNISRSVLSSDLHKSLMTAMSIFTLNDYRSAVADLLRGTYVKDEERNEVEEEIMELVFNTSVETPYETNRIVFGAPGTGKSFLLKEDVKKVANLYSGTVVERVTFHPEYSYSQFVGTYKPTMIEPSPVIELDGDKKEVMSVLQDKTLSAQEKYDLLYDKFKDEGLTRLPILIGMYCNDSFKTRKQDGTDAVGDNSVERNHGRAIRPYVNLDANVSKKSEIAYEYVPGPFMRMYVAAMKSARTTMPQPHILIIEEINRAKVAAVFGDVFQLLDRDEEGVSEYDIQASEDIKKYLAKELGGSPETYNRIRIPNNMFIWATMNSADQGVFPMDTAFKRRWNFEYLGIDKNDEKIKGVGKIVLAGSDEPIEWNKLRKAINAKMSSTEFKINEDKLMGPFFLSKKAIASDENGMIIDTDRFIDMFKSKVIMYLYEDAVKQGKHKFFDGCPDTGKYSAVCDEFDKNGIAIFGPTFKEIFYDKED